MMGMLVTLAGMVHSSSPIVGLGIHRMISIVFGLVCGTHTLGGTVFAIRPSTLLTLMGHLVYALILAAVSRLIVRR